MVENLCIVAHTSDLSGANRALVELSYELKKRKFNIVVLLPRKGIIEEKLKEKNIDYKVLFYSSWIDRIGSKKKIIKKTQNFIGNYIFEHFCKKNKIKLVHYNSSAVGIGIDYVIRSNIPFIWHIRECIDNNQYKFHDIGKLSNGYKHANYLIGISDSVIRKNLEVGRNGNWIKIYDGIDIETMNEYTEQDFYNFIIVGAIEENKNQLEAVKAVNKLVTKRYNQVKLYVVGPVIDKQYYENLKLFIINNNLQHNVIFTGQTKDVISYRKKCACALVCSQYEAYGRVTVEALMNGEMVIGADVGGTSEILDSVGSDAKYQLGNVEELSKKMLYIMELNKKNKSINDLKINIQNIRNKTIEMHSVTKSADRIAELYKKIIYQEG